MKIMKRKEHALKDDLSGFCDLAIRLGAVDAKVIRADQVVVREWVRWKCRFGCNSYGRSLMCPLTLLPRKRRELC